MKIAATDLDTKAAYYLMTSLLIPRPIAWTGSRSTEGVDNLAPFSYFMGVSSAPPALAISVARGRGGRLKDTASNILDTGAFTVSIVSQDIAAAMNQTSAPFAPEQSEFEATGLTPVNGDRVAAPYPAEAKISLECELIHSHDLGSTHLLVGEVVLFHLQDDLLKDGRVDARALDPVARLGGAEYAKLGDLFRLDRARVAKNTD